MSEEATKIFNDGLKNISDKINALSGSATSASEKNSALGGCAQVLVIKIIENDSHSLRIHLSLIIN